jgi:WYL domain
MRLISRKRRLGISIPKTRRLNQGLKTHWAALRYCQTRCRADSTHKTADEFNVKGDTYPDHLRETPLSADQTITVQWTPQLEWWLLGFGAGVTVLAPAALRDKIAHTAHSMAALYRK